MPRSISIRRLACRSPPRLAACIERVMRRARCARLGAGLAIAAGAICILGVAVLRSTPLSALPVQPAPGVEVASGENPHPIKLVRPPTEPLSAMAQLGRLIFFDASLSSSGQLSCAGCHSPQHAYGPPNDLPVMSGGPHLAWPGTRAVPSLTYLERQPSFAIGPDNEENENVSLAQLVALSATTMRVEKTAPQATQAAANMVPQGGLFWDGRADTLQDQALSPLLDPREMDGGSIAIVADKLQRAPYASRFAELFGSSVWTNRRLAVSEALFAVARYQIEDPSFHPYSSKFDFWLEGKARLSASEQHGYLLFNDPAKANCGGCHVDQPTRDGLPPLFTDHQFEALGAPRNAALAVNADASFYDLGICGPYRTDMSADTQYCGLFMTPTLRNVATRRVFFHNGVFTTLKQVMDFYNFRDTAPEKVHPRAADGTVRKFDDLPVQYWANVDVTDPPFDRKAGDRPAMTESDEDDIIAFVKTLVDGYDGK
jgi:cytochrome c peroxidase